LSLPWSRGGGTFRGNIIPSGRIIQGATYFEDVGQRLPVGDVATIVQYDSGAEFMARSQHRSGRVNPCKQPSKLAPHAVYRQTRMLSIDKLSANLYQIDLQYGCADCVVIEVTVLLVALL